MGGSEPGKAGDLVRSASWRSLRQFTLLLNIAIVAQTFAIIVAHELFAVSLPVIALISLAGLLVLFNLTTTFWRLQRPQPVTDLKVLSALDQQYLVRVGSLAAGAAHEMRSPLCTMAVLVGEMLHRHDDRQTLQQNLRIMADQIEACRHTLSDLISDGRDAAGNGSNTSADKFLRDAIDRFRLLRPGIQLAFRWRGAQPPGLISTERDLRQAILGLLNNAADASPGAIEVNCSCEAGELRIHVEDRGPGIPAELGDMLGERIVTTKGDKGTGIGLLLAKTAIRRAGGSLRLSSRPGGGARAEVVLPLRQTASDLDRPAAYRLANAAITNPGLREARAAAPQDSKR